MNGKGGSQGVEIIGLGQGLENRPYSPADKGHAAADRHGQRKVPAPFAVDKQEQGQAKQEQGQAQEDIGNPAVKFSPGNGCFFWSLFFMQGLLVQFQDREFIAAELGQKKICWFFRKAETLYTKKKEERKSGN